MAEKRETEDRINEAKQFFDTYRKEIGQSIRDDKRVIFVDFNDLASFSPQLSEEIINIPEEIIQIMETALDDLGLIKGARVRFINIPQTQELKIAHIRAKHLNRMISIQGIVRQASDVRPQVVNAKFECPTCGTIISVLQIEKKFREPTRCSCGRKGQFRLLSKEMVDAQRLVIEESPESLTGGEQPKRMNVFLQEDLVEPRMEEKTTPGARVLVIGVLKEIPVPLQTGSISTRFDLAIEANNVIPLEETYEEVKIGDEDERQIQELAADPKVFDKMSASIAQSIWGYDEIKKALVLQMFGGVRKVGQDRTVKRGDIHVFLIGDPGVAKSIGKDERVMYISDEETGYDTIENINKKFKRFPKNLRVLTIDMKKHEPRWEKVYEIIKHLPEKDLIKVSTEHGKEIIATKDHSFITLSKQGEIIPIKGEELTEDTYVPIPVNYHKKEFEYFLPGFFNKKATNSKILPPKIKLDNAFGFFIGLFLAEGYVRNGKTIELSNANKEIQKRVVDFSKKLGLNYGVNNHSVSIFSKNLSDILMSYCYNKTDLKNIKKGKKGNFSRIKKIPDFSYFAPKEFIYGLISGLFSSDGRLIKDKKMLKGFELITISKNLAKGTSDLLFSIGILNKIKQKEYTYKNNKTNYYSVSIPTQMIRKFTEYMEILGREIKYNNNEPVYSYNNLIPCGDLVYEVVKKLGYNKRVGGNRTLAAEMRTVKKRGTIGRIRLINLIREFKQRFKQKNQKLDLLERIANSEIIWSKINKIKILKKKNEEVYDLYIPSTNTFVSNGIGVHNSVTLKFISDMAPKGRYIVGKAASGAGITATVVKDEFLRGWALEAGAMVLANGGIVCIDEIEKMDPNDRSAMHEALEQQTVTISKANVQACYSEDTEVLTEEGWKKYGEVNNLKIAQFNSQDKTIKFLAHKGLFIYDYKGEVYHFKNKRNDILVTPNHKMIFREPGHKEFQVKTAEEIKYNRIEVLNSGRYDNQGLTDFILPSIKHRQNRTHQKYAHQHIQKNIPMDLWLEFLGYYVSEGGKETAPTIGITQKVGKNADKIEKCLTTLSKVIGFTLTKIYYKNYLKFKITNTQLYDYLIKNCGEYSEKKRVPLKISELSKKQLEILFDALMLGDGSKDGKNFGSTSDELINQVQMIGLLLGKSVSKHLSYKEKTRGNRQDFYRVIFSKETTPQIKKSSIKKVNYDGKVWCFSTETGFFVTRRNGKVAIQGNTLKAQTSVLAAGNPKLGRFEPFQTIAQQIDLPPALINRFDLIFVLRDMPDKFRDDSIAAHVLSLYQKKDRVVPVTRELFRKYVAYAKQRIKPILTDEAVKEIREFYVKMRNTPSAGDTLGTKSIPISARQLEALVRLSEAHAKMHLRKTVTKEDAKVAIELVKYYLMQVGYDPETKSFDIDRIATGTSTSQRSKVIIVRETLSKLEERLGKFIPIEELEKELEGKMKKEEIEESIQKLIASGDVFTPRKGFVQRI